MMTRIYTLLCLTIIAFTSVTADDNYCETEACKKAGAHTMCKYPSSTPAKACNQWTNRGLSNAEKNIIVNKHNELRQKVASGQETRGKSGPQPAAVHMSNMTWDNEFEKIAQRWADQCDFGHDECRNVDRYAVGQNAAQTYYSGENTTPVDSMIEMWYDEVRDMDKNKVSKYEFESKTGHYTQCVWADTNKVGCGLIEYPNSDGWNCKYLICNYGPSGNWIGEPIYEVKE